MVWPRQQLLLARRLDDFHDSVTLGTLVFRNGVNIFSYHEVGRHPKTNPLCISTTCDSDFCSNFVVARAAEAIIESDKAILGRPTLAR